MQTSPLRFHQNIDAALADTELAAALAGVKHKFINHRADAVAAYNTTADFEALRERGRQIRDRAIRDMPELLEQFAANAAAAGTTVLWAKDAAAANRMMTDIAKKHGVKMAVKSKSMATEEIFLNDALAAAGVEAVETDLGEFIIQLSGERPSHIIAPAMHKTRQTVAELFARHNLNTDTAADAETLTRAARAHLRQKFLAAEMGISGANFLIADTGSALIVTNEGNGRMTTTLPPVHVTLAGIDKIIPAFDDIPTLLALLTRSATGQTLSNYVTVTTGNRRQGGNDADGAAHAYVILLDNGRSSLRGGAYQDMLRCIRCGACMNHCPIYHTIGGQAYGSVYMGPMGQVLTPALVGIENVPDLPYATTMCNACAVVCPVKIPLPTLMRRLRTERVRRRLSSPADRLLMAAWSFCARRPALYAAITAFAAAALKRLGGKSRRIRRLPGASGWFDGRDLAAPSGKTFRSLWKTLAHDEDN